MACFRDIEEMFVYQLMQTKVVSLTLTFTEQNPRSPG